MTQAEYCKQNARLSRQSSELAPGGATLSCVGGSGGSQFRRLKRKPGTIGVGYSLCI